MGRNTKEKTKNSVEVSLPELNKTKGKGTFKTSANISSIEGTHQTTDGFSIIDDEAITPRAFDRTTRGKKRGKTNYFFGENFGINKTGENTLERAGKRSALEKNGERIEEGAGTGSHFKDDRYEDIINDKPEPFHVLPLNQTANVSKRSNGNTNYVNDFMNSNNMNTNNESEKQAVDIHNRENINNICNYSNNSNNITDADIHRNNTAENGTHHANDFDFRMDETPIKSNTAATRNNEAESSAKKYRTPGEIDMLDPDDTLIGNKCVTINNYVSPPKFVNRVGSFSRFPLSGEADINIMDYNGFRSLFKNCACVISEQEYLESSSKESNTNPMHTLREEESEGENEERNEQEEGGGGGGGERERDREEGNETEDNTENGENKDNRTNRNSNDRRRNENKNENYDLHETPNKFARSNTAFPSSNNNQLGSTPKKNSRRRGDRPLNTSKLLDALNIENDKKEKNKLSKKTTDDQKQGSNKKTKKTNEANDKYMDFENKPVFRKDMEGKAKENTQILLMEDLAKKKKNTLKLVLKPHSEELNAIFKKDICELAKQIYHAYSTLNYVISRRNMLNEPLYFKIMRGELQRLGGGSYFTEEVLRQLAWVAPSLIVLNKIVVRREILERHVKVYPEQSTGKKVEDIEVRENSNERPNIYKLTTKEKLEICQKSIISWINVKHNEFLKKLNPDYYLPQYYELKKWHSKFNFSELTFPLVELTEDKVAARLSFTPHESNTDDFIVENDSPLKTVMVDFEAHQHFVNDMDNTRTRTPLGRNKRKSAFGSAFSSPFNLNSPKKETKTMKLIREDASKKKIISEIKNDLEQEEQKLLSEKKYWENAKWIGEIIHDTFVVEGTYTIIELLVFAKKIADKYKNTQAFDMNETKIAELIELLATYIPDINITPGYIEKSRVNISVKSKKNLHFFLEPIIKKTEAITKRYYSIKANKETRLRELWNKYEVPFELTANMKKFFLNPGSITIADL